MTGTANGPVPLPTHRSAPFDPPDGLRTLRERGPISPLTYPDGTVGWLVTGYSTARTVLSDPRFSARQDRKLMPVSAGIGDEQRRPPDPGVFVSMDPPEHTRYRRLLAGEFTARRMRRLTPLVERIVEARLDAMERTGPPVDLVSVWALPIPSLVICELLGVPAGDREAFQRDCGIMVTLRSSAEDVAAANMRLMAFMRELVRLRRARPADDLISALAAGGELDEDELTNAATLLLLAGFETTAQMLALGVFALLRSPAQCAAVREDDQVVDNAVEELLRYLSVIQFGLVRAATEDLELDGVRIRAGDVLTCSVPIANRDPGRFTDPDTLDVRRPVPGHLAFGHGIHQCLGAQLARLEMRIAYPALLRRFPGLEPAVPPESVAMRHDTTVYGVHSLPVRWTT
ncbi:cytochrome P450 [Streptomyces sp. NPDC049881]|uniref:cytochrome P450 n=1 Tax=Streptomyces sp. NPDC049881 TaxID=3155778 RepID=UPI003420B3A8